MNKPKIYTVAHPEDLSPPMANQGFCVDVVLASDYALLQQEIAALDAINRQLNEKVAALAAENTAYENGVDGIVFMKDDDFFNSTRAAQKVMGALVTIKTPATSVAIAEFRAQGVEIFADRLQQFLDDGDFVANEFGVMAGAIHCGRDMAEQLRAEASK